MVWFLCLLLGLSASATPPTTDRDEVRPFRPGSIDVSLRLATDGWDWTPLSVLTSLVGWVDVAATVDFGLATLDPLTIGVGVELYYTRPGLLQPLSRGIRNLGITDGYRWSAADRGIDLRLLGAYNRMSALTPYGVVLVGPSLYDLRVTEGSDEDRTTASFRTATLRTGFGAGINASWKAHLFGGIELRYLIPVFLKRGARELSLYDEEGGPAGTIDTRGFQRAPRGFGWVFYVGMRF